MDRIGDADQLKNMQRISGFVEQGNTHVFTQGMRSATVVQGSFPLATVTVFNGGTTTLSTIFSDNTGTALGNPFTADVAGNWGFYAADGHYDVQFSGGGLAAPFTLRDVLLFDEASPIRTGQLTGFLPQPQATINSTTQLTIGALDPPGVPGQPNLSTLSSVTQYNGAYSGGGASSAYFEQDFNQPGTMAGGNQAVFGISRQVGTGSTAEVDGSGFTAIITNGTVGQLSGTSGICYVGGGTVQTVGTVPGQVIGVLAGVNQSGGVVNGPMVGVLISAADLTGGTRGNVYGLRVDDQGAANFAIRSGASGTNAGVNFFGGTVWIASAGNEHPSDHAVFLAGPETGVENFAIIKTGVVSQYNGQPKGARENGVPFTVASVESDGIAGNVGITVLVPTAPAGRYRLTASIVVQTQATTSSTIPTVYFTYVDVTLNSSTNQVIVPPISGVAANPGPGIAVGGSGVADVAAGTNISYQVTGYSSVGAQPMVYKYYVILEAL